MRNYYSIHVIDNISLHFKHNLLVGATVVVSGGGAVVCVVTIVVVGRVSTKYFVKQTNKKDKRRACA